MWLLVWRSLKIVSYVLIYCLQLLSSIIVIEGWAIPHSELKRISKIGKGEFGGM